jgi:hypothetical protein
MVMMVYRCNESRVLESDLVAVSLPSRIGITQEFTKVLNIIPILIKDYKLDGTLMTIMLAVIYNFECCKDKPAHPLLLDLEVQMQTINLKIRISSN